MDESEEDRRPGWFERSSWALDAWHAAQNQYWAERARIGNPWEPSHAPSAGHVRNMQARADDEVVRARADYRSKILGWYSVLCLPVRDNNVIPNEVELLADEEIGSAHGTVSPEVMTKIAAARAEVAGRKP